MIRTWTVIGVADVAYSLRWYQTLLGRPPDPAAHEHFGQITDADGAVLLCLHRWGDHDHPTLRGPQVGGVGNGLLLFFRLEDFESALRAARTVSLALAEEPQVNPATGTREFALWDPDGYYVMVSALA